MILKTLSLILFINILIVAQSYRCSTYMDWINGCQVTRVRAPKVCELKTIPYHDFTIYIKSARGKSAPSDFVKVVIPKDGLDDGKQIFTTMNFNEKGFKTLHFVVHSPYGVELLSIYENSVRKIAEWKVQEGIEPKIYINGSHDYIYSTDNCILTQIVTTTVLPPTAAMPDCSNMTIHSRKNSMCSGGNGKTFWKSSLVIVFIILQFFISYFLYLG